MNFPGYTIMKLWKKLIDFLKPPPKIYLFLIEWSVFVLILIFQGKLQTFRLFGVAMYPFFFFYLMGSLFFTIHVKQWFDYKTSIQIGIALGLVAIDQLIKQIVFTSLPVNESFTLIPGWLEITHRQNLHGTWLFTQLSDNPNPLLSLLMKSFIIVVFLFIFPIYRYFKSVHGNKFWMNLSFILLFSSILSWIIDMFTRGFILDYIGLPGIVACDVKDIYMYLGAVALILEVLDNQTKFKLWNGWDSEKEAIIKFSKGVFQIVTHDFLIVHKYVKKFFLKISLINRQ